MSISRSRQPRSRSPVYRQIAAIGRTGGETWPPELDKTRPAIVISNSDQNMILQSVVVVPLSSQAPEIWPLRLRLEMPRGKPSFAVLPGIRRVSKARIQETAGMARTKDLNRLDEAIFLYLSD